MGANTLADVRSKPLEPVLAPDFLGIGAQAAGTTWLWANLDRHPAIELPSTKELHFFDYYIERRSRAFRWLGLSRETEIRARYGTRFALQNLRGKHTGEITPSYGVLPITKIRVIERLLPEVRLVLLLRDPVDRDWSHAKKSFSALYGKPLDQATHGELTEFFDLPFVRNRGDYARILENWLSVFDRERIFIRTMEEVTADPETHVANLFEFFGLEPEHDLDWSAFHQPVNQRSGEGPPQRIRKLLESRYVQQGDRLEELSGREFPW